MWWVPISRLSTYCFQPLVFLRTFFLFFFFSCYCCSGICFVFGWSLIVSFSINRSALFYIQVLLFYSPFNVKGPMVGCAADGRTAATVNALQFSVLCRCWHLYRYCPLEEIVKKAAHTHTFEELLRRLNEEQRERERESSRLQSYIGMKKKDARGKPVDLDFTIPIFRFFCCCCWWWYSFSLDYYVLRILF